MNFIGHIPNVQYVKIHEFIELKQKNYIAYYIRSKLLEHD